LYLISDPDVEIHHLEKKTELEFSSINVLTEGPLRSVVSAEVKYGKSKIRVNVSGRLG
jgi:alpha-mannosidase